MNRRDLQSLSKARLSEAKALLASGRYSGAYYLAGYSVECALKAVIAKSTLRHDFPDRKRVEDSYKHDLQALLKVAGLETLRAALSLRDQSFSDNWLVVVRWSEQARYKLWGKADAEALVQAISQKQHGVMAWLIQLW